MTGDTPRPAHRIGRRTFLVGVGAAAVIGGGVAGASFLRMGSAEDYARAMARLRAPLANGADPRELIRYATLAPNGHNTQPWRFRIGDGRIVIRPDLTRRTPVVDPDDHHLYVSLGCAAETLRIAAGAGGLAGDIDFDPAGDGAVTFAHAPSSPAASPLFDAIARRQSTRAPFDGRPASSADLAALAGAAQMPGVDLVLVTAPGLRNRVRDLVIAGNSAQMADDAFMRELKQWIRFNPRAALRSGDGLYAGASGNPTLPDWLGPTLFDLAVTAKGENDKYVRQIDSSAGLAVFVAERSDRAHWVQVGRACQRLALQACALGMTTSFVNQPVEVAALRPELASEIGMTGRRPDLVMRFGRAGPLPMSPRRPVAAVVEA